MDPAIFYGIFASALAFSFLFSRGILWGFLAGLSWVLTGLSLFYIDHPILNGTTVEWVSSPSNYIGSYFFVGVGIIILTVALLRAISMRGEMV